MNRSNEPKIARWIATGRLAWPSASMYVRSNRSGSIVRSTWMVAICHSRPSASSMWMSIFGP